MNIAFVHPSYPGDEGTGATHTATQVVQGLATRGHDVTVYCPKSIPEDIDIDVNMRLVNLDTSGYPYHPDKQLNRALRSRAAEFDEYDVANCYHPSGLPAMKKIGQSTSTAVGVTLNAYRAICPKNDLLYAESEQCTHRSLRRCSSCIVRSLTKNDEYDIARGLVNRFGLLSSLYNSDEMANDIDFFRSPSGHVKANHVDFGFPEDRIYVIPHPIDEKFLVDHQSDFAEPYKLLYVGSLRKRKGVDKLVPILSKVRSDHEIDVRLTVVGKGGIETSMREQASEYAVEEAIEFKGFVENAELPDIYSAHDIFIHPGVWQEPLARVYLEALATKTPIVTREYGSIRDIVGTAGVTTDGSVDDFADSIESMITENRLPELSDNAAEEARRYLAEEIIPQIEEMYRSCL